MAINRYAGDRFVGLEAEKNTLLSQVLDGAHFVASDSLVEYLKVNGSWLSQSSNFAQSSGQGISGRLAKFVGANQVRPTEMPVFESGSKIGFGISAPREHVDFSGNTLVRGQIIEGLTIQSRTGLLSIDLDSGNVHVALLTGNITGVAFLNPSENYCSAFTLQVVQSGAGSNTLSWAGPTIKWEGGSTQAPAITATTGRTDTFGFLTTDGGNTYFGFIVAQNSYV
jgi:hypothetical protein